MAVVLPISSRLDAVMRGCLPDFLPDQVVTSCAHMSVESEILRNNFIGRLRDELTVDRAQYDRLTELLRQLASEWRAQKLVNKAVVQELYVLAPVTKNVADSLREHAPDRAAEIDALSIEIDALVLECLAD